MYKRILTIFAAIAFLFAFAHPAQAASNDWLTKTEGYSGATERFPDGSGPYVAFKTKGAEHDVAIWPVSSNLATQCNSSPDGRILVKFELWEYDAWSPDDHLGRDKVRNICNGPPWPGDGSCCEARWVNVNGGNELYIKASTTSTYAGTSISSADFKWKWWGDADDRWYVIQEGKTPEPDDDPDNSAVD